MRNGKCLSVQINKSLPRLGCDVLWHCCHLADQAVQVVEVRAKDLLFYHSKFRWYLNWKMIFNGLKINQGYYKERSHKKVYPYWTFIGAIIVVGSLNLSKGVLEP